MTPVTLSTRFTSAKKAALFPSGDLAEPPHDDEGPAEDDYDHDSDGREDAIAAGNAGSGEGGSGGEGGGDGDGGGGDGAIQRR